jgi:hypothetical protein
MWSVPVQVGEMGGAINHLFAHTPTVFGRMAAEIAKIQAADSPQQVKIDDDSRYLGRLISGITLE